MFFTHIKSLNNRNISDLFAGGHHSWFLVNKENPLIEDYRPPSPFVFSETKSMKSNKSRKNKKNSFLK